MRGLSVLKFTNIDYSIKYHTGNHKGIKTYHIEMHYIQTGMVSIPLLYLTSYTPPFINRQIRNITSFTQRKELVEIKTMFFVDTDPFTC